MAKLKNNENTGNSLVHGQGGQYGKVEKAMLNLSISDLMHSLTLAGLKLTLADGELKVCGDITKLTPLHKQSLSHHKDTIKPLIQPIQSTEFKTITVCIEKQICNECGGRWLDITEHDYRCGVCNSKVKLTPDEIFWPSHAIAATANKQVTK